MSRHSEVISSQDVVSSGPKMSVEHSHRRVIAAGDEGYGFLRSLGRVLFCSSGRNDDNNSVNNAVVGDSRSCTYNCLHWFCCSSRHSQPPKVAESHSSMSYSSENGQHWLSSPVPCTSSHHVRTIGGTHRKCVCVNGAAGGAVCSGTATSRGGNTSAVSKSTNNHSADVVLHHSAKDCTVRSKAVRRVLLADAEYGHATALDDALAVSDSDAWSGSLSNSRPNSGDAGAELGAAVEFGDELSVSLNEDEDEEEDVWRGVASLPVPPVYDQVKEPSAGWSLAAELRRLVQFGWYWGPITRVEAEEKLAGQEDGTFLVRDSSDDHYLLSLSFRSYGRTLHTRIEHCQGAFSLYSQSGSDGYQSIVELIERSIDDSRTGVFCYSRARALGSPSFPVRLTRPVSRFSQVRTLQYLCRFVIRQYTRVDHIQQLPLPTSIKGWLEERPY